MAEVTVILAVSLCTAGIPTDITLRADSVMLALDRLCELREDLRSILLNPSGQLQGPIALFLNNSRVNPREEDVALSDGDTLFLLAPISG